MQSIIHFSSRWTPPLLVMCAIFLASSLPGNNTLISMTSAWDKLQHATAFCVLGLTLVWPWREQMRSRRGQMTVFVGIAIAMGMGFGALDEYHQSFVPGRYPDMMDWYADTVGTFIGAWCGAMFFRKFHHPNSIPSTQKVST